MNMVFTVFLLCVKFKERVVLNFFGCVVCVKWFGSNIIDYSVWDEVVMER